MKLLSDDPRQRARIKVEVNIYDEYGTFIKDNSNEAVVVLEANVGEKIDPDTLAITCRAAIAERFSTGG